MFGQLKLFDEQQSTATGEKRREEEKIADEKTTRKKVQFLKIFHVHKKHKIVDSV